MRRLSSFPAWVYPLSLLIGFCLLAWWMPFLPYANVAPVSDVRDFTPSLGQGLLYGFWLCLMFALYWGAFKSVSNNASSIRLDSYSPLVWIVGLAVLFSLPLLFTFPFNANDIYRYFIRGRVGAVYGENPFTAAPNVFANDVYLPLAGEWAGETTPYGPLWEWVAWGVTRFVPNNLVVGLLLFKMIGVWANAGISYLIWQLSSHKPLPERAGNTLLWAWNPAVLLILVADGHNDGLMLLGLLGGWLLLKRGWLALGVVVAFAGILIKPIALLAFPFIALAAWQNTPSNRAKMNLLGKTIAGTFSLLFIAFIPFGSPIPLIERLLREASGGNVGFSPAALIILLGQRVFAIPRIFTTVNQIFPIFFAIIAIVLFILAWRGRNLWRSSGAVFTAYLVMALPFRIWYAIWAFPFLLLDDERGGEHRRNAGILFLLTTQFSVIIYGHLWRYLFQRDSLVSHLIGVPFVFLLPLLIAWLQFRHSQKTH